MRLGDFEVSWQHCDLFQGIILVFVWRDYSESWKSCIDRQSFDRVRTGSLQNEKQDLARC
jgi:hypothetical protein